jgi:hypothetical protein
MAMGDLPQARKSQKIKRFKSWKKSKNFEKKLESAQQAAASSSHHGAHHGGDRRNGRRDNYLIRGGAVDGGTRQLHLRPLFKPVELSRELSRSQAV